MTAAPPGRQHRGFTVIGLVVALAATSALVIGGAREQAESGQSGPEQLAAGGRTPVAAAWPEADLRTLPGLPLGPLLFLDTATVVGTAPSPDDQFLRLLLRAADGSLRELRRLPAAAAPRFENVTAAGDDLVWTEFADGRPPEIWAASRRDDTPSRRLTADTGNVMFYGSQYDLVHQDGRVHWTATPEAADGVTELRSVALTGGPVRVVREPGEWTLAAWPWLDDGASDGAAALLLRDRDTGHEITVPTTGGEFPACSPAWCRVLVLDDAGGFGRIDLMRPDGSDRRQIAGGTLRTAVPDVAILDRFEILAEPGAHSAASGTAGLLVHDIRTGDTVELSPAANDAQSRDGFVWWYTSSAGTTSWQVLDLRTVPGGP